MFVYFQIQKRLLKELSQKEQEIMKLTDNIHTLNEERALEEKKRCYAEGQTIICMSRIKELECKLEDLKEDLEVNFNSNVKLIIFFKYF